MLAKLIAGKYNVGSKTWFNVELIHDDKYKLKIHIFIEKTHSSQMFKHYITMIKNPLNTVFYPVPRGNPTVTTSLTSSVSDRPVFSGDTLMAKGDG